MAKKKPKCKEKSKRTGKRCKAYPIANSEFCAAHDPLRPADTRFGSPEQAARAGALGGAAGRQPRPIEIMRERIEADIERYLAPIEAALEQGKPIQMWDGDARKHYIEFVGDPKLGMQALKMVLDYAYGRPRQSIELTGEDGGAVKHELEFADPKVREAMHGLVRAVADAREGEPGGPGSGG